MKRILCTLFVVLGCAAALGANGFDKARKAAIIENPDSFVTKDIVECIPRNGAPNFIKKLHSGVPEVKIAYFGGSITAQTGYRIHSRKYIQSLFQATKVEEINAAIGGTATDLGVFRCWHDVTRENPDIVVVEFAVNDSGLNPGYTRRNLEGIIRQIWTDCPKADIVFVYTVVSGNEDQIRSGKMSRAASTMEDLADYYGIPSIHFGAGLAPLLEEGKLEMKATSGPLAKVSGDDLNQSIPLNANGKIPFAPDGVHPYDNTGHVLYEQAIERSIPQIKAASKLCGGIRPHKMPKPLLNDCIAKVATVSFDDPRVTVSGSWKKAEADNYVSSQFLNRCDDFFVFEPGAEISFKFKGSKASFYDIIGPESSAVIVTVDGQEKKHIRFDGYCTYHRLALMDLCSGLDPKVEHTVTVKVSSETVDKRKILFKHNRGDYDGNPSKYAPAHYFAGCIFIAGEIIN